MGLGGVVGGMEWSKAWGMGWVGEGWGWVLRVGLRGVGGWDGGCLMVGRGLLEGDFVRVGGGIWKDGEFCLSLQKFLSQ